MNDTQRLLERVRARNGNCSDYRLAKLLDISTQRVSLYMSATRELGDDETIVKAAELAGMNPTVVLVDFHAARAKGTAFYAWERLRSLAAADTITRAALCAFMSLGMMFGLAVNPAGTGLTSPFSAP